MKENYLSWRPKIDMSAKLVIIPFSQIKEIKKQSAKLILPNGLGIYLKDGTAHHFASFMVGKRNEAFEVINHFLANPVTFVKPNENQDSLQHEMEKGRIIPLDPNHNPPQASTNNFGNKNHGSSNHFESGRSNSFGGSNNNYGSSNHGGSEKKKFGELGLEEQELAKKTVDLQTTKNIIKNLHETNTMGSHVLEELDRQSEVLNRIENNLDEMDSNLKIAGFLSFFFLFLFFLFFSFFFFSFFLLLFFFYDFFS